MSGFGAWGMGTSNTTTNQRTGIATAVIVIGGLLVAEPLSGATPLSRDATGRLARWMVRGFQAQLAPATPRVGGVHGTSFETLIWLLRTGRLPPSTATTLESVYFYPVAGNHAPQPIQGFAPLGLSEAIQSAGHYAHDTGVSHHVLRLLKIEPGSTAAYAHVRNLASYITRRHATDLALSEPDLFAGLRLGVTRSDCAAWLKVELQRARDRGGAVQLEVLARGIEQRSRGTYEDLLDAVEFFVARGVKKQRLLDLTERAVETRRGVILLFEPSALEELPVYPGDGDPQDPDDLRLHCPNGLPDKYVAGVIPRGLHEQRVLRSLSSAIVPQQ